MEPGKPSQAITLADQSELTKRVVLTPAIQADIAANVAAGMFEKQACDFAGIDPYVYRTWKKWGASGVEPYAGFLREIKRAQRDRIKLALEQVQIGDKNWKAAAWWLDRVYPEWREGNLTDAPLPHVELSYVIKQLRDRYSPEELQQVVRELAAADLDPLMDPHRENGDTDDDAQAMASAPHPRSRGDQPSE